MKRKSAVVDFDSSHSVTVVHYNCVTLLVSSFALKKYLPVLILGRYPV